MSGWVAFSIGVGSIVASAILIAAGGRTFKFAAAGVGFFAIRMRSSWNGRSAHIEASRKQDLIRAVRERASRLGAEVPVSVSGHYPAEVQFSTGRRFLLYRDLRSYRAAAERGEVNPVNAHFGRPPAVLPQWSREQLTQWLASHDEPEPGPRSDGRRQRRSRTQAP